MMTFKQGDTFSLPIQFYDTEQNVGITLTPDMQISSTMINAAGKVIAEPNVAMYPDQIADAGMIVLHVAAALTEQWPVGMATMDIRLQIGDVVKHSHNFQFKIERSIST